MRPEAERWFLQAKEELEVAKVDFQAEKWFASAFWCQQSIEKSLKALFIVKKKESAGTTHSLTFLGRELEVPKEFNTFLKELNQEYYISRYPDATDDIPYKAYNSNQIEEYIEKSEKLILWVEQQLKK